MFCFTQISNMNLLGVLSFCFVICSPLLLAAKLGEYQEIYLAAARCNGSEKFIYPNYSCYAKSYSRNFSTVNIIWTTKMPLYNIFVRHFIKKFEFLS